MAISKSELRDLLTAYRQENWRGIQTPQWQESIVEGMMADAREPEVFRRVAPYWKPCAGARVLDVGSGVGGFVVACRNAGVSAFGVEPDRIGQGSRLTAIQIARKRLDVSAFVNAVGEQLPFPDNSFDMVVLDQVIEHVTDQRGVLREALRVVRRDGIVYVACPNYLRFYEPHYKIAWLPLMPRKLGSWYLRLRGRNPVLLGQLNYTTNWRVHALLRSLNPGRVIDLNREQLRSKLSRGGFLSARARLVGRLAQMPVLGAIITRGVLSYLRLREGGSEVIVFPRK